MIRQKLILTLLWWIWGLSLFALLAMMISVVSFPMLVDRDVGLDTAIRTSFRAVVANPGPMAL